MAFDDDYSAYGSLLKKSKTKDSFHGEGLGSELKIAGSSVAEQVEDKHNKEEIDGDMASDDEYQEEDSNPDGCESQWSYDSENKGYVKLLDKYDSQIKETIILISTLCLVYLKYLVLLMP
ncbi:hypothetical protein GH714_019078 [Hevea brasiliensis]|uniref:Uncharacterized protein n=1 Tax=Hevea brasiliensis TaxID=3981 RepID=A0A6A6LLS2_HEVBR|nr:hypothetical protein GH714_019078 [Hevea brasiliensis]